MPSLQGNHTNLLGIISNLLSIPKRTILLKLICDDKQSKIFASKHLFYPQLSHFVRSFYQGNMKTGYYGCLSTHSTHPNLFNVPITKLIITQLDIGWNI